MNMVSGSQIYLSEFRLVNRLLSLKLFLESMYEDLCSFQRIYLAIESSASAWFKDALTWRNYLIFLTMRMSWLPGKK